MGIPPQIIEIIEEEGPVIEEQAVSAWEAMVAEWALLAPKVEAAGKALEADAEEIAEEVEAEGEAILNEIEEGLGDGEVEETTAPCEAAAAEGPQLRSGLGDEWLDESGNPRWPPNNGAAGPEEPAILEPGTTIDRYGGEGGSFASSPEASYAQRSLPYDPATVPYQQYEVLKPLPTMESEAAPWFDQPGGASQYRFDSSIRDLVDQGFLKPK
jgi:hypothetical protein